MEVTETIRPKEQNGAESLEKAPWLLLCSSEV